MVIDGDDVGFRPSRCNHFNRVAEADVLQSAEKTVSVSRNRYIAVLSGIGRTCHVTDSSVQAQVVGSFQDRNFDMNLGYTEDGYGRREMCCQALLVILDASLRPQTEVRSRAGQRHRIRFVRRGQLPP